MEFSKLSKADQIIGGAGVVFLLSTFLSWFSVGVLGFNASGNGWDVGFLWGRLPFLVVLAMIVWIGLRRFSKATLPSEIAPLYLAGGATALLPFLKLLVGESGLSRDFGLVLAALTGAAVAFGTYLKFLEVGGNVDELKGQASTLAGSLGDKAKAAAEQAKDSAKETAKGAADAHDNVDKNKDS
jgi:hypothetical protein